MFFTDVIYIGVDPSGGDRPLCYAALDHDLKLVALDEVDTESFLAFAGALDRAIIALDAPQAPNEGFMAQPAVRQRFNLAPAGRTWRAWRVCEYELRRRNIRLYNTPEEPDAAHSWVQSGFELFTRLEKMGFRKYIHGEDVHSHLIIEARSHAGYCVLLNHRPLPKETLEGRLQRQLVLYLEGVDLANPMHALEEITRHHLLTGNLPLQGLQEHAALDALMAAFSGYLVNRHPDRICQVGERVEGLITLPAADLMDFYH